MRVRLRYDLVSVLLRDDYVVIEQIDVVASVVVYGWIDDVVYLI